MRCAILDDYQGVSLQLADWDALAGQVDVTVHREHIDNQDQLVHTLKDQQIVVIMRERTPFRADLLHRLPHLKLLITSGMRNASIDLTAAAQRGITVCGTASTSTPPAELTWALILGLARHLVTENNAFRTGGPWQSTVGTGLAGKTLGLIGFGKIGIQVARVARAFDMHVTAWSANLTADRTDPEDVRLVSKEQLLTGSDIVSVHIVLSDRTRGLIGAGELALMRPGALLINTSRAAVVDQHALVEALRAHQIGGAGLDVYDQEPLPAGHPLRTLPNVLATPHLGYVTDGNYRTYFREAVENIQAFIAGTPTRTLT
ncbi:D-2-hydroxyacid dehydrogenase family protein [Kibdelosporangium phytohabitans]|uniref:D-2-hydroxyacid dehydrogenase family protein n=1 Tax=Kibdelosporangium phytohabitans TaxID=860235 RepID=UPI001C54FC67|nr:D-2-hydroxyacid dehydrogenase family protein [Kibdelosporangium phytohabitans]